MRTFHPDFDLNVEACAFTYLMAKTEAIMTHDQGIFFSTRCGTAGCLAGHAARFQHSHREMSGLKPSKIRSSGHEALFGIGFTLGEGCRFDQAFGNYVVTCFDNQQALRNFKRLVRFASTDEEWEEFKRLTTFDAKELLSQTTIPA